MSARLFRAKKSEWLLWVFYFLAFFTVISFVAIFARFVVQAVFEALANPLSAGLLESIRQTLKILGVTYLWVLPWAAVLTIFYFTDELDWKRQLGRHFVKVCLRIPPIAVGAMVLFAVGDFSLNISTSLIIGFIALPRLLFGWAGIVKTTPSDLRDAGLSLGMSRFQLLRYIYWNREGFFFFKHFLRVTCLLLGAVAPFVYLADQPISYFSLDSFVEIIKNPAGTPVIWSSLLLLFVLTFLLTPKMEERR